MPGHSDNERNRERTLVRGRHVRQMAASLVIGYADYRKFDRDRSSRPAKKEPGSDNGRFPAPIEAGGSKVAAPVDGRRPGYGNGGSSALTAGIG